MPGGCQVNLLTYLCDRVRGLFSVTLQIQPNVLPAEAIARFKAAQDVIMVAGVIG
jgi:hypothetical protein